MGAALLLGAACVAGAVALGWHELAVERSLARAAGENLRRGLGARAVPAPAGGGTRHRLVAVVSARAARLTRAGRVEVLAHRIGVAGLHGRWTVERVLVLKALAAATAAGMAAVWIAGTPSLPFVLLGVGFTALGWSAPDLVLRGRADERRAELRRELPDVVDRLCLLVDAGLGFDAALRRTVRAGGGALVHELGRAVQDVQLGSSRADALAALAERTDVPEVRRVVGSLRQADRFGVPIAAVLRNEATALRDRQLQLAEERAQKLPVRVLFPLVFCIMPALLLVVAGPAVGNLGGLGG